MLFYAVLVKLVDLIKSNVMSMLYGICIQMPSNMKS